MYCGLFRLSARQPMKQVVYEPCFTESAAMWRATMLVSWLWFLVRMVMMLSDWRFQCRPRAVGPVGPCASYAIVTSNFNLKIDIKVSISSSISMWIANHSTISNGIIKRIMNMSVRPILNLWMAKNPIIKIADKCTI